MTTRRHGDLATLRPGCFPQEEWRHPPHDHTKCGDAIRIREVPPDSYDELDVIEMVSGKTTRLSGVTLMECSTDNGWRCYLRQGDFASLNALLTIASNGIGGVQAWMRGAPFSEAMKYAREAYKAREERRQQAKQSTNRPDISLDDIEI